VAGITLAEHQLNLVIGVEVTSVSQDVEAATFILVLIEFAAFDRDVAEAKPGGALRDPLLKPDSIFSDGAKCRVYALNNFPNWYARN
jgi:hypothetical protein